MKKIIFISGMLIFGAILQLNAQATPRANARQANQQARIIEGKRSGELSPEESRKLQMQQGHIRRTKRQAKADGVVTPAERAKVNRKQNRASRNIAVEKKD